MQEMIKRILEIDEEARRLTEEATALKLQTELSIEDKKKQLHDEYIERARKKIEALKKTEAEIAEKDFILIKADNEQKALTLDEFFAKQKEGWLLDILNFCTDSCAEQSAL